MGITRTANITGLDSVGLPVVMVCRPNSRSLAVSQGKGLTLEAAKASALMESVEFYHAERITQPLKLGSYEQLRYTHNLLDEESLPRTSISLFNPTLRLLWIEGHDLMHDEAVWVPYELVHTDYTLPFPAGSGCSRSVQTVSRQATTSWRPSATGSASLWSGTPRLFGT
jgi:ribosomal protein S12 methylthiotransferase accessory factor